MTKPTLLLLALAAGLPLAAQAAPGGLTLSKGDSSLQLYGLLDVGIANVAHSQDFDPYHSLGANPTVSKFGDKSATGMIDGGISPSRIGLKGSTTLFEGWQGVFTLEGAINVRSGNTVNAALGLAQNTSAGEMQSASSAVSGQLFARGAFAGISNKDFGTLTFGRHTALFLDTIGGYDALQGAQLFTPIGYSGSYGGGGATENSRVDDSVKYKGQWNAFSLGLLHKFGGVAGSSTARSTDQVSLAYEPGAFGITVAYQSYKDAMALGNPSGSATQPLGTVTATAFDTKGVMLAARYKVDALAIKGGYEQMKYSNPSDPLQDATATSLFGLVVNSVNVTPYTVAGQSVEKKLDVYWLGAAYDVTSKFNIGVGYYHVKQNDWSLGTTPAGSPKNAGNAKYTSLLMDYHFSKAFDTYLGFMGVSTDGGLGSTQIGYLHDSNATVGLGLRYSF
ncbi:MAG TPA: porin [Holophagaceae bacterium]